MRRAPLLKRHENWIAGRPSAASGGVFTVLAAEPESAPLGAWPRSSREDVAAALDAARAARDAWRALDPGERGERLARLARELAEDAASFHGRTDEPGWPELLRLRLGLRAEELAPRLGPPAARSPRELAGEPAEGLAVLRAHWSELVAGPASTALELLARGHVVLLLPDARAPMVGDALARASERAELPPGALGVLHDDGDGALTALLGSGDVRRLVASGYAADLKRIAYRARTAAGGATAAGFGAGVVDVPSALPELDLVPLRSSTLVVPDEGDLAELAARVVTAALGRTETLSGQLPGQVGRVLCPERRLSRFTEELLAALARSPDVAHPVPPIDAESRDAWRRMRELGLDEGATLILGGGAGETTGGGDDASSPRAGSDARFWGSVFTNVEADGRLARLARPAPVLRLLRVGNEAAGRELARRLDGTAEPDP